MNVPLEIVIIETKLTNYPENEVLNIHIKNKLGSGSYGSVFDIGDECVIKLFYNSELGKTILEERDSLIPYQQENRELSLYFKLIKGDIRQHFENNIISPLVLGFIQNDFILGDDHFKAGTYFVILPYCISFHRYYKIRNNPLLDIIDSNRFCIEFLHKVLRACIYLENIYNVIHLDIKLNNVMYMVNSKIMKDMIQNADDSLSPSRNRLIQSNDNDEYFEKLYQYHDDLILLDYSLIKKRDDNDLFKLDEDDKKEDFHYYIWPLDTENYKVIHIPTYSIGINILELMLGRQKVKKLPHRILLNDYIKTIENKYEELGRLLYKMLNTKMITSECFEEVESLYLLLLRNSESSRK